MEQKIFSKLTRLISVLHFIIFFFILSSYGVAKTSEISSDRIVSHVDISLDNSQKYTLNVDGKPFYMVSIQIRLDKLRYHWGWDAEARDAVVKQAANDGFNTVVLPIHWYEIEPIKDKFQWDILDEYLGLANKYNLKVELLWWGQNSGGLVQWLGSPKNPVHLRTPDYVLYSPEPGAAKTTSNYKIKREMTDYSLDMADTTLRNRETYVLSRVMEHVAQWDKKNGNKHSVIGVQINNEVRGKNGVSFPGELVMSYLSHVAGAVKKSEYVVWTRVNTVYTETVSRIAENEALRESLGSNIDFVGIDTYRHHFDTDLDFTSSMRTNVPYIGKNFRMIMEIAAEYPTAGQLQIAALSGNNNLIFYEMIGPDMHGLYKRKGETSFTSKGEFVEDVRMVNKILNSASQDIATNANGYGLFVHNWSGTSAAPTKGIKDISFAPVYPTSQGISIQRSNTEVILMTTKGGTFSFPDSLHVKSATKGYFDAKNEWVYRGNLITNSNSGIAGDGYTSPESDRKRNSIFLEAGTTARLTFVNEICRMPKKCLQAEFSDFAGGVVSESHAIGFAGMGYLKFPLSAGYAVWYNVDGFEGGNRSVGIRYSNGTAKSIKMLVFVNGVPKSIWLKPTGSWERYDIAEFEVFLSRGGNNTIRLESTWTGSGYIDELQIL